MLNHEGEKEPVEFNAARTIELLQLRRRQHTRHERSIVAVMCAPFRDWLPAITKPRLHKGNLITLRDHDAFAESLQRRARIVCLCPPSDQNRLSVVWDHAGDKSHIRLRVREVAKRSRNGCGSIRA
jgi:hypothetical protein